MDKGLLVFMAIGVGFLYFVTTFIGDIQEADDTYQNEDYVREHKYDKYLSVDSIGQEILVLKDVDPTTQVAAWHASSVKREFLELFPDYSEMKKFIKERTSGAALEAKVLKIIDVVEGKFFSGTLTAEQAKQMLDSLK